jgi:hypothetical protein
MAKDLIGTVGVNYFRAPVRRFDAGHQFGQRPERNLVQTPGHDPRHGRPMHHVNQARK